MLGYVFERFPKFSQTFCYREIEELFRQGERPAIFSLRAPELGPEPQAQAWNSEILGAVHQLPEGARFAELADAAARELGRAERAVLRKWRGKPDSLRLHQAVYIGVRMRAGGITHVHAHFAGMAARVAWWIRRFFGIPFTVTVHANDIFAPEPFEIGLDQIFGAASAVVAVSDFAAEFVRKQWPHARVHRVYNGIRLGDYKCLSAPRPGTLVSVGRLIRKKGFDLLIETGARARDVEIEIIGDGPLAAELQALIDARGVRDRVRLRGSKPQREIISKLCEAAVFALPCRVDEEGGQDNLPTVIMEAMAAARPVVSTPVAGVPEMVVDGETGILCPSEDVDALARAIGSLFENPDLAQRLGVNGRARAAELFDLDKNVAALRAILATC